MDKDHLSIKIPILHRSTPYVYIKMNLDNNRYRLSCNYKYLNEHYDLKIKFIRNLEDINQNSIFKISNNQIEVFNNNKDFLQSWQMGSIKNSLKITRILNDDAVILILHRTYAEEYDDQNFSVFFASKKYNDINTFLGELDV